MEAMNGAADSDHDGVFTVSEVWQHLTDHGPVTAKQLHGEMTPQLKGQFGGRFLLSIDAAQLARRMTIHDERVGKRTERSTVLKEMALENRIAVEHFKEAQKLMEIEPDKLSSEQVDLLAEYSADIEDTLPPETLPLALELAQTTPSVIVTSRPAMPIPPARQEVGSRSRPL